MDSQGNIYFTDQGQTGLHDPTGRVYRLSATGRLELLLSNVPSPNGIVLSPDEKFLFVAVTRGNCVWRMPILADGSVSKTGQFFTSYGPSGPDGLAMDTSGRLLVANLGAGLRLGAEPSRRAGAGAAWPAGYSLTNLAFGSAAGKTLFVTDSTAGGILCIEMDVAGLPIVPTQAFNGRPGMTQRWKHSPEGSHWGEFGGDDQRGRMNLVDRAKVLQGIAEVKEGMTFCLSLPLDVPGGSAMNPRRQPPRRFAVLRDGKSAGQQGFCWSYASEDPDHHRCGQR
ncbi:SMP-30/gluconolactonase/LRE family protein [Cupriavidus basilensis]